MSHDIDLEKFPTLLPEASHVEDSSELNKTTAPFITEHAANSQTYQLFFELDTLGKKKHFSRLVKIGDTLEVGLDTHCDIVLQHNAIEGNSFSIHVASPTQLNIHTQGPQAKVIQNYTNKKDALIQLSVLQLSIGFQNREKISAVEQSTFNVISQKPSRLARWSLELAFFCFLFFYFLFKTMTLGYVSSGEEGGSDVGAMATYTIFFSWGLDLLFLGFFGLLLMLDFRFFRKYRAILNQQNVKWSLWAALLYVVGSVLIYTIYYWAPNFTQSVPNLYNIWWVVCVSLFFWRTAKLCLVSDQSRQIFKNLFVIFILAFWIIQNYGVQTNYQSAWFPQKHYAPAGPTSEKTFMEFLDTEINAAKTD